MKRGFCSAGAGIGQKTSRPRRAGLRIASGVAEGFLRGAGPAVLQHPADRDNQHGQHGGADQQCDGAAGEEVRQQRQLIGLHMTADQARRQVTQRARRRTTAPIIWPRILSGASRVMVASPIGLRHSSPSVSIRMLPTSHSGDTPAPPLLRRSAPPASSAKARRCAQDANHEFGHTARTNVFYAPAQATPS